MDRRTARSTVPALLRQYRVLLAVLVVVAGVLATVATTQGGRAEFARSVSRQPEPFVAMYFADPPVTVAGLRLTVAFVVEEHDPGSGAAPCPYRIVVRDGSGAVLAAVEGAVEPAPDAPARVGRELTLRPGPAWATIDVTLPGRPESLYLRNQGPT